jgi:hypothetical protein
MSFLTDQQLTDIVNLIANETAEGANTKTRVAAILQGLVDSKPSNGSASAGIPRLMTGWNASGNTFPDAVNQIGSGLNGAIQKGNMFNLTVAGVLDGVGYGVGTLIIALTDTPCQTGANWRAF